MAKESGPANKKEVVEPQFLQIYESLPPPQNNKQFSELLAWMDKDRDRVFAYAKFKYIFKALLLVGTTILLFATSERLETVKWFLKLLLPFLK